MTTSRPQDSKPKNTATRSTKERPESALDALAVEVEAVTLKLRNMELELEGAYEELDDTQGDLEDTRKELDEKSARLHEKELELQNTKAALAESEAARRAANPECIHPQPRSKQGVFIVLKFRNPKPLPEGAYRLFTLQRKALKSKVQKFLADNSDLDAVEVDELRFNDYPDGKKVYEHMRNDKNAPIKFHHRRFVIKEGCTEDRMKAYILECVNRHKREE